MYSRYEDMSGPTVDDISTYVQFRAGAVSLSLDTTEKRTLGLRPSRDVVGHYPSGAVPFPPLGRSASQKNVSSAGLVVTP